jgi:copper chaperone CopZ
MNRCPRCEAKGRAIDPVTLKAQVLPDRLAGLPVHDEWRLCTSEGCEVVYFRGNKELVLGETRAVPFHKREDPKRLVCFCFEHSVAELEADVAANGMSTIQASIKAACTAGQDDCKRKNPQGRCCLGNVGHVVKRATPVATDGTQATGCCGAEAGAEPAEACCAPKAAVSAEPAPAADTSARSGLFASGGALVAAVLSSACCWLPLVAIGLGASSAGVGAFFEAWRVPLLLATVALLGVGFYLVYRKPRCAPGEACAVPNPRLQGLNRGMLWLTTVFVAAFAFFPEYVGAFTGGGGEVVVAGPAQTTVQYRVEGMTCAGCEGHAREAIEAIPGVVSVAVSYRDSSAEVVWSGEPDNAAVAGAIAEFGYRANPLP